MASVASTRMLSIVKEELPTVASELVSTARASTTAAVEGGAMTAVRAGEKEIMNPMAVRQMAEMSVKETAGESSILGQHLSITRSGVHHPPPPGPGTGTGPTSLLESLTTTTTSTETLLTKQSTSVIAQTIEKDVGVSVKEAISNAGQTGLEEVVEQLADTGKVLMGGGNGGRVLKPEIAL